MLRIKLHYAILTKILPKLNGTSKQLSETLDGLIEVLGRYGLTKSKEKCEKMKKILDSQGFVSFI